MIENGKLYTIDNKDYMVMSTYEDYAMLLNVTETAEEGSGDMIIVQSLPNDSAKVIKDDELLTQIINNMLK